MKDIKDRAREYLIKHSEYSEVFDQTFVAVDTLTAMVDFAEQENAELQVQIKKLEAYNEKLLDSDIEKHNKIVYLETQIEKMKNNCLDLMRVQSFNLTDDYMAGMYNGMAVVYNSCFLDDFEKEGKGYCHKNNFSKWELVE